MKWFEKITRSEKFQKYLGWITLVILILLFIIKLTLGHCRLWLCGLFVATVTGYYILSDWASRKK